jgi:hypothetical protein
MNTSTRRGFLVLTGTGVAAAAAASAPTAAAGTPSVATATGGSSRGPVVAYVRDTASGEISVMSGEREVIVHNRSLAALIARQIG